MRCSFDLKSFRIILGPRRSKIVLSVARLDGDDRISNGEFVASLTVAFRYVSNTRTVSVDKFFFFSALLIAESRPIRTLGHNFVLLCSKISKTSSQYFPTGACRLEEMFSQKEGKTPLKTDVAF